MFQRFAVKGPCLLLGMMAALLPASQTRAAGAARSSRAPAVLARPGKPAPKPAPKVAPVPTGAAKAAPVISVRPDAPSVPAPGVPRAVRPGQAGAKAPASQNPLPPGLGRPEWLRKLQADRAQARREAPPIQYSHGGGIADVNLDNSPSNQIEPTFFPDTSGYFALSSNALGGAGYPGKTGIPAFLDGPDYHIFISRFGFDRALVRLGVSADVGEQFEPSVGRDQRLALSAFMPLEHEAYSTKEVPDTSDCKDDEDNPVTFDGPGAPVRVIGVSDDAIALTLDNSTNNAAYAKVLPAEAWSCVKVPGKGEDASPTYRPRLVPDASPVWYPDQKSRIIYFVSLRGYKADDESTHYTSLWRWDVDTNLGSGNPSRVLKMDNKSILFPTISRDGRRIAFTVSDTKYEPGADGELEDIVWGFDVTDEKLQQTTNSKVFVATVTAGGVGSPQQATNFVETVLDEDTGEVVEERESRDLMPFFSPTNQLGFSTDRLDTDGDGMADAVAEDPATALFDIYTFTFPLDFDYLMEQLPDFTAQRRTLGDAEEDDSNELRGSWATLDPQSSSTGALQPLIIYQADDAGNWDIWMTDLSNTVPVGPPAILTPNGNILLGLPRITGNPALDDAAKQGLRQTHRIGLPGDFVNISVRVNPEYITRDDKGNLDYENTKVYAVVKDPDPTDPNYFFAQGWESTFEVNNGISVNIYTQQQAGMPVRNLLEDYEAYETNFAGSTAPPRITRGGVVELSPEEGRPGRFSADVFTKVEASDYLLDIIVVRNTPNIFTGEPEPEGFYTDNIGGYSTAPFMPTSRILLVSDFMAGQKVLPFTTNTLLSTIWPVESYVTWRQRPNTTLESTPRPIDGLGPLDRGSGVPWATLGPLREWQEPPAIRANPDPRNPRLVAQAGTGMPTFNPLSLVESPYANEYDLWRVQCREPILYDDQTDAQGNVTRYGVMKHYLPYIIDQPGYPVRSATRKQRIADRAIYWMAPYAGQLNGNGGENSTAGFGGIDNLGMGTVANINTQAEILKFMTPQPATKDIAAREAGRIAMSGATIATTLTAEGGAQNPLLARFNVVFESPYDQNVVNGGESSRDQLKASRAGIGVNPIAYDMWEYAYLGHMTSTLRGGPLPTDIELAPYLVWAPFREGLSMYGTERRSLPPKPTWEDGAWNQLFISTVQATGIGQPIWNYGAAGTGATNVAAVETKVAPAANENTSSRKHVFFAFGLEGVNRYYYVDADSRVRTANRPAQIFHNLTDFLTTGTFQGRVFINNNVNASQNVLVYAIDRFSPDKIGQVVATALTDANGNYTMEGLDAGVYELLAYRAGTATAAQNPVIQPIDILGDATTRANLYLISAQPGTLRGVVRDTETGKPVAGVTVKIQDVQGSFPSQTVTNENGEYVFNNVQKGLYIVTVEEQTGTVEGQTYLFQAYTNSNNPVTVNTDPFPGDERGDTVFNFGLARRQVLPEPATLEVSVFDDSGDASRAAEGAKVTVFDAVSGAVLAVLEDSPSENPGTVGDSGKVTFRIKAGQVNVRVEYGTFKAQNRSLIVQPDTNTPGGKTAVTFRFGGVIHTFTPNVVLMASAPYSYAGTSGSPLRFSQVLGLTENELDKKIVAFNSTEQQFVYYPTYPADTFHLGFGYGMKLPKEGRVLEAGAPAPVTGGYFITRANIGWNLIGNPFPGDIAWSKSNAVGGLKNVKFALRDDPTRTLHDIGDMNDPVTVANILTGDILWGATETDAFGNGIYRGNYSNRHTVLKPWQSYWVKVAQPVLLYFPRAEAPEMASPVRLSAAASERPERASVLPEGITWGLDITAASGKLEDTGLGLGLSRYASAGEDAGLDLPKPGPLSAAEPMLYTAFLQPDGGLMATDVRAGTTNDWAFIVNTNLNVQNITLTWKATGSLPAGATLVLVDLATGQRVNMGATSQYTFRSARTGGIRRFRVELRGAPTVRPR